MGKVKFVSLGTVNTFEIYKKNITTRPSGLFFQEIMSHFSPLKIPSFFCLSTDYIDFEKFSS
jgi:hypothetical protein